MFDAAASGRFPSVDGGFEVFAPEADGRCAIVEFTGHSVVLGDVANAELAALGADGIGGASRPEVKLALAGPGGWIGCHDALLVARGRAEPQVQPRLMERDDLERHPRVVRSREHRRDVVVLADDDGLVTVGRGLVDRLELSVELFASSAHGASRGRHLIEAALEHVASDRFVWAQVSPGNAASLRAFLAAGFVPIGAETLIVPAR